MASLLSDIPIRPLDPQAAEEWMLQYRDRMGLTNSWPTTNAVPQISAVRWNSDRSCVSSLNLEHNLDSKDPIRLIGKSGRWVLKHRKQEGPEYPARGMLYHTPIPPLPYSSVNSIDNSGAVERGNNLLPQTIHNAGDQVNSNIDLLLYGFEHTQGPRDEEDLASAFKECYKITAKRKRSINHHNSSQVPDQLPDAAKQRVDNAASSRLKLRATGELVRPLPAPHSTPILVNDPPSYITITVDGKSVSLQQKDS
ncbi:hypothetical protein GJ744_006283 [Endocarpon pusillum]|uniref:Uncharacterized protein n=1 Tax=Endocarpon pusillum TaxID=364733 RepID=A0A8H7A841_9EURO|nr:hypothetical protein GJ744_006283 [Endocarpon pusillum]